NFVFIMADDMGYSDLGCYGSEIKTPNIDRLAANGLKLRNFYNNSRCCPTRASLLTGRYPHQVGVGHMVTLANAKFKPGPYQGFLDEQYPTIAEALKKAGYGTYMSGKWHVGERKEHWPRKRGFDRYYGLISGSSSFYEITPQERAKRFFALDDNDYALPDTGHYMTDAFTGKALEFLQQHNSQRKQDPFFLYLAYTAPHFPLHAPEEGVKKYENLYTKGWDEIRKERYRRMKEIGLLDNRYALTGKPSAIPDWNSVKDQAEWVRKMAVYAAMIDRMDQNIGRLIEFLKESGQYENTVIVFLSDNGACAETVNSKLLNDPSTKIGEKGSYAIYGEPWANVSATPFKKYKHYMHEGGINTPFIIQWPAGIQPGKGFQEGYGHVMDLLPTALELAGAAPMDLPGQPLSHLWKGKAPKDRLLFWEHEGNRAVRKGNWKLVQELEDTSWALYNLKEDPSEIRDLSAQKPAIVAELLKAYDSWSVQMGVRKVAKVKDIVVTALGAKGDGVTYNTQFIQEAIEQVSANGGGRVVFPEGRYLTASLTLRSNVDIHLQKGAVLLASPLRKDYGDEFPLSLLKGKDLNNVWITGSGMIDGNGRALMKDIFKNLEAGLITDPDWKTKRPTEKNRGHLLWMNNCTNVHVKSVTFKDATSWVLKLQNSRNMEFDSIKVESMAYWNNDGIDLDNCSYVKITNSHFNTADDAVCLKSESRAGICDNILVENCVMRSSASAFKMGTASYGGFKNITVRNITVYDTYRSAIALEAVDGGIIENVEVSGVRAKNTGNALFIKLGKRNKDDVYSSVSNIRIRDVKVEVPAGKPDKGYEMEGPLLKYPPSFKVPESGVFSISPHNHSTKETNIELYPHNVFPSSITGLPGHRIKNVQLEDIEIIYEGGAQKIRTSIPADSLHIITEAAANYPEFSMFGELPAWGMYLRHLEGISIKNVILKYRQDDFRIPFVMDDVQRVNISNLQIPTAMQAPVLWLRKGKEITVDRIWSPYVITEAVKLQEH
ncbi:MAG: hypothetical protein RLZZ42_730, partial [Bacteroidota bacterium]